ncbi:MAG: class SAM-dependent methyltransferase [Ilumatobacteraceae bacterium]|nr:class SAM-dependent methyltransferase [Ilumatobacteraceae bacterium]
MTQRSNRRRPGRATAWRQRAFWTIYALAYDALWDAPLTDEVVAAVEASIEPGEPVLEVGAGTGLVAQRLARHGRRVVATEPAAAMRRRFQERCPQVPVSAHAIEELTPDLVDEALGRGGVVLAVHVIHVTEDPVRALEQLRCVAGPRPLVIVTPVRGANLAQLARAHAAAGRSRPGVAGFLLVHALLAPAIALLGPRPAPRRGTEGAEGSPPPSAIVRGVAEVVTLSSASFRASRATTRDP